MRPSTVLGLVLTAVVVIGLIAGWFHLSLASFVLWGLLVGVALASFAKTYPAAAAIGPIYSFGWMVALIVFAVTVVM
jgi:hypothetical protein